jgi:hypothetical protein
MAAMMRMTMGVTQTVLMVMAMLGVIVMSMMMSCLCHAQLAQK